MRKATLCLQPRRISVVQKFQMESCSHAADLDRYETRPAFLFALVRHAQNTVLIVPPCGWWSSFEKAAGDFVWNAWFWVVLAEPRAPNPKVSWSLVARPSKPGRFFKSQPSNRPGLHRVGHCRENGNGREKRVNNQQISSKTNKSLRPWSHVSHVHKLKHNILLELAGDFADT